MLVTSLGMKPTPEIITRFFAKTRLDQEHSFDGSPCITWTASTGTKQGHGRFNDSQRFWVAHQFAYALANGPIPDGMRVWRRCLNKLCVNHQHMELVTEAEVGRRGMERYVSPPTFRCCGREKTPGNSFGGPGTGYTRRCKHCLYEAQKQWRKKPGVQDRINAQQRAAKAARKSESHS